MSAPVATPLQIARIDYFLMHTTPDIEPGVCYGQLDIGVKASFLPEAERILAVCRHEKVGLGATIFTSPLRRSALLAEYLSRQLGSQLMSDTRLRELDFGAWEGQRWDRINRAESELWTADVWNRSPPNGETYEQLSARVTDFAAVINGDAFVGQQIIIVSHAGPLKALLSQLLGLNSAAMPPFEIALGGVSKAVVFTDPTNMKKTGVLQFLNR